jgi:hypothetical protein
MQRLPRAELASAVVLGGVGVAIDARLGMFVWAVGILLAVNQMRSEARFASGFERLDKAAEVVDLNATCDVDGLNDLVDAYLRVPEEELTGIKSTVIATARDELVRLATEKSSGELSSGEYYRWLLPMIGRAPTGSTIYAVSLMMSCEWDDSPSERLFIKANLDAAKRGVNVERIFIMPAAMLPAALQMPAVESHTEEAKPKRLKGYYVPLERLQQADAPLAARVQDGFIAFGDRAALIDRHSVDGSARGVVTLLPGQVAQLHEMHEELLMHADLLSRTMHQTDPAAAT